MHRRLARSIAATGVVLASALVWSAVPASALTHSSAAQARETQAPPNERKPATPTAPDLGSQPWSSEAGLDPVGYRMSTYTGRAYAPEFEQFRLCVVQRESGGQYGVVSGSGYLGAYQFGSDWGPVIVDRLTSEMVSTYGSAAKAELARISRLPINRWPRFWQDAGFWVVFAKGSGASNWDNGNWDCRLRGAKGWPNPDYPNYSPIERSKSGGAPTTGPAYTFGTKQYSQRLAQRHILTHYRWGPAQFDALQAMWRHESNWDYRAINRQGPWYGLGQVNGDFIAAQGFSIAQYMKSPMAQIKVGAAYIKQRYGTPTAAWAFWRTHNWY